MKQIYTEEMTIAQIKACIVVNDENFKSAMENVQNILKAGSGVPYYTERLIVATDLCSEIAHRRARLERDLAKAQLRESQN